MECKFKLYVPLFIPLKIKKNIQQVGLENIIVSQIVNIEIWLVVVVNSLSKPNLSKYITKEKDKSTTTKQS